MTGSGKKQDIGKKTEYTDILHTHTPEVIQRDLEKQ